MGGGVSRVFYGMIELWEMVAGQQCPMRCANLRFHLLFFYTKKAKISLLK